MSNKSASTPKKTEPLAPTPLRVVVEYLAAESKEGVTQSRLTDEEIEAHRREIRGQADRKAEYLAHRQLSDEDDRSIDAGKLSRAIQEQKETEWYARLANKIKEEEPETEITGLIRARGWAADQIKRKCGSGELEALGRENDKGDLRQIPQTQWSPHARLDWYNARLTPPSGVLRGTKWADIHLLTSREQLQEFWPPSKARPGKDTSARNRKMQKDAETFLRRRLKEGDEATLPEAAKHLYQTGKFINSRDPGERLLSAEAILKIIRWPKGLRRPKRRKPIAWSG